MKLRIRPDKDKYQGIDVQVLNEDGSPVKMIRDLHLSLAMDETAQLTVTTLLSEIDIDMPSVGFQRIRICPQCKKDVDAQE